MGRKPTTPTTVTASSTKSSQGACSLTSPVKCASKCERVQGPFRRRNTWHKNPFRPHHRLHRALQNKATTLQCPAQYTSIMFQCTIEVRLHRLHQTATQKWQTSLVAQHSGSELFISLALSWPSCLQHSHSAPSITHWAATLQQQENPFMAIQPVKLISSSTWWLKKPSDPCALSQWTHSGIYSSWRTAMDEEM